MKQVFVFLVLMNVVACTKSNDKADGYGNF